MEMAPQQQGTQTCNEANTTSSWMEAYHATMRQPAQPAAERTMPERPYDNEAQAPTHDALSAIYNRGY